MTEIAFDFASAANGTRSVPAQISSPQVNATFTSTVSPLLGIASSINFYHQFNVNNTGTNFGNQQGYVYVQLTSTVPIQLTRVRFWMQSPALDPGLALAIEASEKADFSERATLETK